MRGFASLLVYLVAVSAVISIGAIGLIAIQSPIEQTPSAPAVAVDSHTKRLAEPAREAVVAEKKAHPDRKRKMVHVNPKHKHEVPTIAAGDAYGYAQEPRRFDWSLSPIFGR